LSKLEIGTANIGKQDEKRDSLSFVSRQFTRRFELPDDVKPETIVSALTTNGILMIEVITQKGGRT
jgi:crystallin alpha B